MEKIKNIKLPNGEVYELGGTGLDGKITNCITEIPQRIKLELNNGTLTLKAGSEVIVPNGFEADGTTPKFDYVKIESDISNTSGPGSVSFLFYDVDNEITRYRGIDYCSSGASDPATNSSAYYQTNQNIVNYYTGAGVKLKTSLPLAIISGTNTTPTSIDQVFNGFGYIGSIVWVDKGVKGLAPDGRNEDGSLKNIECTTSKVLTFQITANLAVVFDSNQIGVGYYYLTEKANLPYSWYYDEKQNLVYRQQEAGTGFDTDNFMTKSVYIGNVYADTTGITSFNPKQPFRAVDYSDSSTVSGWSMPSSKYIDLTLGASGTTYTAPANGWFVFQKSTNGANQSVELGITNSIRWRSFYSVSGGSCMVSLPAKKGESIYCVYNAGGATSLFRFIYAEGEV